MKKRLNIAAVSRTTYWHGMQGGMDLHGKLLSEGLLKKGHQVSIITTANLKRIEYEENNGLKVFYLNNTLYGSRRAGWQRESTKKLFQLHSNVPFDVIWSQSFDAFGLASFDKSLLNIPMVTILHGCIQQELKSFTANITSRRTKENILAIAGLFLTYFWVQRRVISYSDKIIAVSQEVSTSFQKYYGGKFNSKCVVVENGVDTEHYYPNEKYRTEVRDKYGIDNENVLIMAIGRITKEKGFHVALEAIRCIVQQNMKVKFIIVGSGEYLGKLKLMVQKYNLKDYVIFTGFVDNIDTVKYYNGSDIVLNPSLTAEGSSLVLLEAMSCGKPVIASKVGGINSIIIDGKNGFLVDPGCAETISDKIQVIVNNKSLAQRISVSAKETILKNFTINQMVNRTLAVIEEMTYKKLS
jgi:glycosyltransferase involved in cell wall biosynthesis